MKPPKNSIYTAVNLDSFIIDTNPDFNLYLRYDEDNRYVLFHSKNTRLTNKRRQTLLTNKVAVLYIDTASDYDKYVRYVERHLHRLIESPDLNVSQKTNFIFSCAKQIVNDAVVKLKSGRNVSRSKRLVKNLVLFISWQKNSFKQLQKLIESDYSITQHSINVCIYALALCRRVHTYSFDMLENIALGALLHDIGMTVVPENILNKKGPLDEVELKTVQRHPKTGVAILKSLSITSRVILDIVKHHHEKLDGTGYPGRLQDKRIPFYVKIIAIADIFDALTSHRPHRGAYDTFNAFKKMTEEFKGKIDFDMLKKFIMMFK